MISMKHTGLWSESPHCEITVLTSGQDKVRGRQWGCYLVQSELSENPGALCRFTLGLVRMSAVSGNSTGDRVISDELGHDGGPWLGELSGLRLGDAPVKEGQKSWMSDGTSTGFSPLNSEVQWDRWILDRCVSFTHSRIQSFMFTL